MGELLRRRDSRNLWVSRSHLHAAVVAMMLSVAGAFAGGYHLGASQSRSPESGPAFVRGTAGEDLVALLARVDASDDLDGGVGALTFPDQLTVPADVADVVTVPSGRYTIEAAHFSSVEPARAVRDHLREAGLGAWVGVERVAGQLEYRVGVGGFPAQASAESALSDVVGALETLVDPTAVTARVVTQ